MRPHSIIYPLKISDTAYSNTNKEHFHFIFLACLSNCPY